MVAQSVDHKPDNMLRGSCSKRMDLLTLPPQTTELSLYCADIDDDDLKRLQNLPLRQLSLQCVRISDRGLSYLSAMHDLIDLNLISTKITDQGLHYLSSLRQLERLNLWGARSLNGEGLKYLQDLPRLRWLNLGGADLDELALFYIGKLRSLQALEICVCSLPEQGLRHLSELTNLHLLRASHNAKAGRDLSELGTLTKLEVLDLWLDAGVDDTAMQAVASMPNLRYLDLQATSVGDIGLMNLYCLNNLENVNLNSTKVTLRGQRELQEAKPKIQFGPAKTLKLPEVLRP